MNSRQDVVSSRTARIQANRRKLLAGLVISVGLHVWAFTAISLTPADLSRTAGEPERVTMQSPFERSAIEVVQVVEEREEVELLPLPSEEHPVVAAAATETTSESAAQDAELGLEVAAADAGSPGAPGSETIQSPDNGVVAEQSAPAPTFDEILESAMGSRPVAVQPMFAAQRPLEGQAPVEAVVVDPHAGHDHVEVEEGSMWGTVWRRMGKTFGFGGDKLCIPIPKSGTVSGVVPGR